MSKKQKTTPGELDMCSLRVIDYLKAHNIIRDPSAAQHDNPLGPLAPLARTVMIQRAIREVWDDDDLPPLESVSEEQEE